MKISEDNIGDLLAEGNTFTIAKSAPSCVCHTAAIVKRRDGQHRNFGNDSTIHIVLRIVRVPRASRR